jgi:hypothetical protein
MENLAEENAFDIRAHIQNSVNQFKENFELL